MTVELATGRYSTFDPSMGVPVAITLGRPKFPLRYKLEHEARRLAPWGLFDVKDPDEFTSRYRERLDKLDLDALLMKFEAISAQHGGLRAVLLCFEDVHAGQFCHRRVFAEWFERRTGQRAPELEIPAITHTEQYGQLRLDVAQLSPEPGTERTWTP